MKSYRRVAQAVILAVTLVGCSGAEEPSATTSDDEVAQNENSEISNDAAVGEDAAASSDTTVASTTDGTGVEGASVDGIEELWLAAGADEDLASCYADVLRNADVGEVQNLNELQAVMVGLDGDGQMALNNCLNAS